jgi:hypothetical protein
LEGRFTKKGSLQSFLFVAWSMFLALVGPHIARATPRPVIANIRGRQ